MRWKPGRSYAIAYTSESGGTTQRTIDLLDVYRSRAGVTYLKAWCHFRGEGRTFREDRVERADAIGSPGSCGSMRPAGRPAAVSSWAPAVSVLPPESAATGRPALPPSPPPPLAAPEAERRTFGEVLGSLFSYAAAFCLVAALLSNFGPVRRAVEPASYRPAPVVPVTPRPAVAPRPVPPVPKPGPVPGPDRRLVVNEVSIGGYVLRTSRFRGILEYEVPSLGVSTRVKAEAVSAIRYPQFVSRMGFEDYTLMNRYLAADLDGSGRLSFDELEEFQKKTYREFRYTENDFALRPDRFLAAGGGDCEDFALYTAGLLRFWGWDPYIASFGPSNGAGHAVCFSYEAGDFPAGYLYYRLDGGAAVDGTPLKSGRYVPIDYEDVGALSNAVERRWKLREVYIPEKIWGLRM